MYARAVVACATVLALVCVAAFGRAQELVAPISFDAEILDPSSRRAAEPVAGAPMVLALSFNDTLLNRPAALKRPAAFLRPVSAGDADCGELARARRATGALARGDIALDGYYLVLLTDGGRITIVDPQISLATSNILRVIDPGESPRALAVNSQGAIYASLPSRNVLAQIDPASGAFTPVDALKAPEALVPLGAGVVALAADGVVHVVEPGRTRPLSLPFSARDVRVATQGMALVSDGARQLALVDGAGALRGALTLAAPPRDIAYSAAAEAVLSIAGDDREATISFIDGSTALRLPIPHLSDAVFMSSDGRHAIVAHRASGAASIVDMALGQVMQAVAFEQGLTDVRFTQRSILFLLEGRAAGALMPRSTIVKGQAPALRHVPLGAAASGESTAAATPGRPVASETQDHDGVLTLSPTRDAILRLNDAGLHENLSLASIALKGDRAQSFFIAPRGLQNVGRGRFEAMVTFARGALHRIVALDDRGALLGCRDIAVKPGAAELARARDNPDYALALSSLKRTDRGLEIDFTLNSDPAPVVLEIVAQGLGAPWRSVAPARVSGGNFRAVLSQTARAPFALYAVLETGAMSRPLVVETAP